MFFYETNSKYEFNTKTFNINELSEESYIEIDNLRITLRKVCFGDLKLEDLDGFNIEEVTLDNIIKFANSNKVNFFVEIETIDQTPLSEIDFGYAMFDKSNNELVKFKYNVIDQYDNYFLFVNRDNKIALYDSSYNKIVDYAMEYNTLLKYDLRSNIRSINLYKVNGKIAIVNNYLEDINGTEYEKHSVYIMDGNTIIKEIEEIGFGYDNIVYTYDNKYNISIYNSDISLLCNIKLEDVNKINSIISVSNEIIKIEYVNIDNKVINEYYDLKGKKNDFKLGNLYFKDIDFKGYIKKNKGEYTLSIYDFENTLLTQINGKKIKKYNNYLIVDKGIYRINRLEN